jgi:hypothetical protein
MTGVSIAKVVGVSQPRVSQVVTAFAGRGAVRATPDGFVAEVEALLDLYEQRARPTLVEPEAHWFSTAPLAEQAGRIARLAQDQVATVAFSADLAPDLLVPWRHPTQAVVYTDAGLPLGDAGFVPAEGRADASIIVRHTADRSLLEPAGTWPRLVEGVPLVDPVQQWWDLLDLGGEDRVEAATRLRRAIVDRTIPRPP